MDSKDTEIIDRIDLKLDRLDSRLDSVDKTLVKQEANLAEHMRRTQMLESQMVPVQKHIAGVEGALKYLGGAALFLSVLGGILKLFRVL